ncbi:sensor histidine kinase [Mycobacterium sp. NBC_00419]|uniref:sensor histidine kinase n=1 Tax=Mycobacterium sp. NBC_00419 TaxID=2975989 RepID=UPI002E23E920
MLDYLTTEPVRVAAVLRLPLIVLIALLVYIQDVEHWLPDVYGGVLLLYAAFALGWLVVVVRTPIRWWFGVASTAVDVFVVLVLCLASGGATVWLLPVFFLVPITVAFLDRPELTAALGLSAAGGYLLAWIVYSKRDDTVGLPNVVYVQVGCLLWLAAATTALCFVLSKRRARVQALLAVRKRLVAESMQADERNNRRLSEQLHDGPLQNLLAARLDLEDLRDRPSDEGFDRVEAALRETVTLLRNTVTSLHPQVLAQVGLGPALRELVRQYQQRWDVTFDCDIDEVGKPRAQALLYRAARELLANAHKHSRATHVQVALYRAGGAVVLRVVDDGVGFDPSGLDRKVADGHIGLASLVVGIEEMGGSLGFSHTAGGGSTTVVTMPDQAPAPKAL